MIIYFIIFIITILLIVITTKDLMIKSIRRIAIYLKWNNNIVGNVLGYITSMPELINAVVASSSKMIDTSLYNVLSSNIINVIFVIIVTIYFKRFKSLNNKKYYISYILVILSIILPFLAIKFNLATSYIFIFAIILLYLLFIYFSKNNKYFEEEKYEISVEKKEIKEEEKKIKIKDLRQDRKNRVKRNIIILIISVILLYLLGEFLGYILNNLNNKLMIPEIIIGIFMGIITSLPEFMTFVSSYKRHRRFTDIDRDKGAMEVVNNLLTSNISNLCIIQGIAIFIYLCF